MTFAVEKPEPNFSEFKNIMLRKEKNPKRVPLFEHAIDDPIIKEINTNIFGYTWADKKDDKEKYLDNIIKFHFRMGYDAFKYIGLDFLKKYDYQEKLNQTKSQHSSTWRGAINNWEDFEKFPWPDEKDEDFHALEYISRTLPDGMQLFISSHLGPFALISNTIFGIETLSYLLFDDPDLIRTVIEKISEIKYTFMKKALELPNIAGIWSHDDMGYKTSTMMSPDFLREYILPHHKKMAELAHNNNKLFFMHSCGNVFNIFEDLIEDIKIDAKHSFEDQIRNICDVKNEYGDRVGLIGGVDVDNLCRYPEEELRLYIRNILETCMQGGGYAFGSGNSIPDYVPVKKYLIMLEEALRWRENH